MYSEDVVENRSVRQKIISQDSESQIFFLKEKNIENIRLVMELKSGEIEFCFRGAYILFILAAYLPRSICISLSCICYKDLMSFNLFDCNCAKSSLTSMSLAAIKTILF